MTDAADDTFAGLTEYEPVYEMRRVSALELGFGTSQDDERVSLSRVDSMLLDCEESEDVVDRIWPASSLTFEEPDAIPSVFGAPSQSLLSDIWAHVHCERAVRRLQERVPRRWELPVGNGHC